MPEPIPPAVAVPASPSPAPVIPPKEPFRLKAWHVIVALVPIVGFILSHINCVPDVLGLLHLGQSKGSAAGQVVTTATSVTFTPKATKEDSKPKAVRIHKAPDDKVDITPDGRGGNDVDIHRLALILEPTIGAGWDLKSDPEPVLGIRLVKYSNIGAGVIVTTKRAGPAVDYRLGNVTGSVAAGFPYLNLSAPGVFVSANVIPFN